MDLHYIRCHEFCSHYARFAKRCPFLNTLHVAIPNLQVTFRDPIRYKLSKQLFVAAEGTYSGQVIGVFLFPMDVVAPMG